MIRYFASCLHYNEGRQIPPTFETIVGSPWNLWFIKIVLNHILWIFVSTASKWPSHFCKHHVDKEEITMKFLEPKQISKINDLSTHWRRSFKSSMVQSGNLASRLGVRSCATEQCRKNDHISKFLVFLLPRHEKIYYSSGGFQGPSSISLPEKKTSNKLPIEHI